MGVKSSSLFNFKIDNMSETNNENRFCPGVDSGYDAEENNPFMFVKSVNTGKSEKPMDTSLISMAVNRVLTPSTTDNTKSVVGGW